MAPNIATTMPTSRPAIKAIQRIKRRFSGAGGVCAGSLECVEHSDSSELAAVLCTVVNIHDLAMLK